MNKLNDIFKNLLFAFLCIPILLFFCVTRSIIIGFRYLNHRKKIRLLKEIKETAQQDFGVIITTSLFSSTRFYDFHLNKRSVIVMQSLFNTAEEQDYSGEIKQEEYVIVSKKTLLELCEHESVQIKIYQ